MSAALTPREREVRDLMLLGLRCKPMARLLGISRRTVEIHRGRVLRKSGVENVVELVRATIDERGYYDS